jgi:hypothetical protein
MTRGLKIEIPIIALEPLQEKASQNIDLKDVLGYALVFGTLTLALKGYERYKQSKLPKGWSSF